MSNKLNFLPCQGNKLYRQGKRNR